jgi:iron complex outermembrane receptor protein
MKQLLTALLVVSFAYSSFQVRAQEKPKEKEVEDLIDLSLEELMNVEIVSASKKTESLFDAPLSASVLTRDEIKKAGATSIPEAFRLIPGLIVREQTNGNFDIHVRGLDNVPPNSIMVNSANTTTLIMIDNRPVYNYLQGGTLWETLPIDLNDVERIEVVRGAAAAMYGPNAVSGVINIITRKVATNGVYALANTHYGTNRTAIANASIGYQRSNKLSAIISGNFQRRERDEISYYRVANNDFVPLPDSLYVSSTTGQERKYIADPQERYPFPAVSMNKHGINAFIGYQPTEKVKLDFTTGLQNSQVQSSYAENLTTPLSTVASNTHYVDVKVGAYGLSGQASYVDGTQNPVVGGTGAKYDFNTLDANIEYGFVIKKLTVKPALTYRKAVYDDSNYWNTETKEGVISGREEVITYAASVRADYSLFNEKLRIIGSLRADKFNYPQDYYVSYQLVANYKLNEKNLFRVVQARANRSPFIYDTYLDKTFKGAVQVGPNQYVPTETYVFGNKELKLVTSDMTEMGYKVKVANNLQLDVELFRTITRNYADLIQDKSVITPGSGVKTTISIQNLPLSVRQNGLTISANYVINKIQVKPFVTLQETKLRDYSSYYTTEKANPVNNINSGIGTSVTHKGTPGVYGGAYINYHIHPKVNINLNGYYFSSQTYYHRFNTTYRDGQRGVDQIAGKFIANAKISYSPIKHLDIFVSGKNIAGQNTREFYKTDNIGTNVLAGLNFEF